MIKSNIFKILSAFDKKKLKSFRLFLNSPYHNSNSNAVKLFDILEKYHPRFDENELTRESIFEHIYNGKYIEWKVRNLLSELMILAGEFLAVERLKTDELYKVYFLNDQYINHKLYDNFKKSYNSTLSRLKEPGIKNNDYYFFKWLLEYQMLEVTIRTENEYANYSKHINIASNDLIKFILYQSLSFFQPSFVTKESVNLNFETSFLKFTLKYLEEHYSLLDPLLKIFYCFYNLLIKKEKKYFNDLENLLSEYEDNIDYNTKINFYIALHRFCVDNFNDNNKEYTAPLKKFSDIMAERGYHNTQSGYLSEIAYRNTAIFARVTGEIQWARNYLETYKEKLKPDVWESNYGFSMATLSFHEHKFEEALKFLSTVKYEDYLLKYQVDSLLLRIHYELGNIENAFSLMDSNYHFIVHNTNSPESYRLTYKNFLVYYRKILTLKLKQNPVELKKIKDEITEINIVASKGWLLEKLNEMEKI